MPRSVVRRYPADSATSLREREDGRPQPYGAAQIPETAMATPQEVADRALAIAQEFVAAHCDELAALAGQRRRLLLDAQERVHATHMMSTERERTAEHIAFALLTAAYQAAPPYLRPPAKSAAERANEHATGSSDAATATRGPGDARLVDEGRHAALQQVVMSELVLVSRCIRLNREFSDALRAQVSEQHLDPAAKVALSAEMHTLMEQAHVLDAELRATHRAYQERWGNTAQDDGQPAGLAATPT